MYSDPKGVKRPMRDRLGSSSYGSSPHLFIDRREALRRQPQYVTSQNGALHGERDHVVRKVVCNDATASKLERDALRSPRSIIVSATEGQKIDRMSAQTPKIASLVGSKGRSTTNVTSAKESVAPTSGEKKSILMNVETFLQKLGLSKYIVTFKAEEIDMYALKHMNDDDFKSIGVPMGPRKKILNALARLFKAKK